MPPNTTPQLCSTLNDQDVLHPNMLTGVPCSTQTKLCLSEEGRDKILRAFEDAQEMLIESG
jgi:hypothetical protein